MFDTLHMPESARPRALDAFLSLFFEHEELEPGVWAVSLALGECGVRIEARLEGDTLALRCRVDDVLPASLQQHEAVLSRLPACSDLLETGTLARGDDLRLWLELTCEVDGEAKRIEALRSLLERIGIDCARLRGAAEGIAHVAEHPPEPRQTPPARPDAKRQPHVRKQRLWDRLVEQSPELSVYRKIHDPAGATDRSPADGEAKPETGTETRKDHLNECADSLIDTAAEKGKPAPPPPGSRSARHEDAPSSLGNQDHEPSLNAPPTVPAPADESVQPRAVRRLSRREEFDWVFGAPLREHAASSEIDAPAPPIGATATEPEPGHMRPDKEAESLAADDDALAWLDELDAADAHGSGRGSEPERARPIRGDSITLGDWLKIDPTETTSSDILDPEVLAQAPELLTPSQPPESMSSSRASSRLMRQGDELQVLSWMDECEHNDAQVDAAPVPRRSTLAIPEALLPQLHKLALTWYRTPERTDLSTELRKGDEAIYVQCGFEPGERSWRYRRPMLTISRPHFHMSTCTYEPEAQELSIDEVEAWLLSEGLIDEDEVARRREALQLRERSYEQRAEGDTEGAIASLEQALEYLPEDPTARTALAHIHRKELGDPETALRLYEDVLAKRPRFVPALLGRAMLLVEHDRHRAAEEAVQALALNPDDPDALEMAGLVSLRAGRRARARTLFLQLFRFDRRRGEQALLLLEAERDGEKKWDPALVIWERRALTSDRPLDSMTKALYEERIRTAERLERLLEEWETLNTEDRCERLRCLGTVSSYTFLSELVRLYGEEEDAQVRDLIADQFLNAPTPGAMALQDGLRYEVEESIRLAALEIAARLRWRDLLPHILTAYRFSSFAREIRIFNRELLRFGGPEVAMALLAKLERGVEECLEALFELLDRRPEQPAALAAEALREVLETPGVVELEASTRRALLERLDA